MTMQEMPRDWSPYCTTFSEQNAGRKTRLGVFERKGSMLHDYWLENGLPFRAIYIKRSSDTTSLFIAVGELNHEVKNVDKLNFRFTSEGEEDGIDVTDFSGCTTVLRFEEN